MTDLFDKLRSAKLKRLESSSAKLDSETLQRVEEEIRLLEIPEFSDQDILKRKYTV